MGAPEATQPWYVGVRTMNASKSLVEVLGAAVVVTPTAIVTPDGPAGGAVSSMPSAMNPGGPGCATSGTRKRPQSSMYTDRKSTRLNSSHLVISYAVFCLKKKNNKSEARNPLLSRSPVCFRPLRTL